MGILSWLFADSKKSETQVPPQAKRSRFDELLTDQAKHELGPLSLGNITLSGYVFGDALNDSWDSPSALMTKIEYQYVLRNLSIVSFDLYRQDGFLLSDPPRPFEERRYTCDGHRSLIGNNTGQLLDLFKTKLGAIGPSKWDMHVESKSNYHVRSITTPNLLDHQATLFHYCVTLLVDPQNETVKKWGRILDAGKAKAADPAVKQLVHRLEEAGSAHIETIWLGVGGIWGKPTYTGRKYEQSTECTYIEYAQIWQDFSFDEKLALAISISELTDWLPAGVDKHRNPSNGTYEWVVCMKKRALLEKEANADRAQALKERQARQIALEKKPFLDL